MHIKKLERYVIENKILVADLNIINPSWIQVQDSLNTVEDSIVTCFNFYPLENPSASTTPSMELFTIKNLWLAKIKEDHSDTCNLSYVNESSKDQEDTYDMQGLPILIRKRNAITEIDNLIEIIKYYYIHGLPAPDFSWEKDF